MDTLIGATEHVNGVDLHYVRGGDGPLLLFVHGYPRHWYLWRHQLSTFSADHTVVAVDLRGYNLSSKPPRDLEYGVWIAAEDIRALVEALDFETCVLIGHDWGGGVSWSFALHHPDVLDGLVVMCAAHPAILDRELHHNPSYQQRARFMFNLRSADGPDVVAADDFALLRATLDFDFLTDDDRAAYLAAWRQPGAARSMLAIDRREGLGPGTDDGTPARGNYAPEFLSLRSEVPTLVMFSPGDPYNDPACFRGIEAYVPDATTVEVGATHWLPEEVPEQVNDLIRRFLRRCAAS